MIEIFLEIISIGCGVISLLALIMITREGLYNQKLTHLSFSDLPVKKTTYCQMVLDWCHENISLPNTCKPTLKVNYYSHKKWGGVYNSLTNECVIYINTHDTILGVTNAIIHEYTHARQMSKNFDKIYEKYQNDIGYKKNPFEIEARDVAKKYEKECMIWVYTQIFKT